MYEKDFKELVQKGFQKSMEKYDAQAEVRKTWDTVQGNVSTTAALISGMLCI